MKRAFKWVIRVIALVVCVLIAAAGWVAFALPD